MAHPGSEAEYAEIRAQTWFHGSITRHTAESRLEECEVGTYLFRESETRPGFSLSLRVPGDGEKRVKHFMISQRDETGLWYLVGKKEEFNAMRDLIEHYSSTETNKSDKTCLLYPCPNAEENPYVQMDNTVEVDRQALEDARRSAEERRGSGASGAKK